MVVNNLLSNLPPNIGLFLPNLQGLVLGINALSGIILNSISNSSHLIIIDFSNNSFSGLIPKTLGYSSAIVHCDLKPIKVLQMEDMVAHIADFGMTKLLSDGDSMITTMTLSTFEDMALGTFIDVLLLTSYIHHSTHHSTTYTQLSKLILHFFHFLFQISHSLLGNGKASARNKL